MEKSCNNCKYKKTKGVVGYNWGYTCKKYNFTLTNESNFSYLQEHVCDGWEGDPELQIKELKKSINFRKL